jgi:hypothetical protein
VSSRQVSTFPRTLRTFPMPLLPSAMTIQSISNIHTIQVSQLFVVPSYHRLNTITALNGYCAKLTGAVLDAVRSDPNVRSIKQDYIFSIDYESTDSPTTDPAPRAIADFDPTIRRDGIPGSRGQGIDIFVVGKTRFYAE